MGCSDYYVYFFSMQQLHLISDIDECEEKFHNCDPDTQICVNTQGSFECQKQHRSPAQASCPVGFQLDIGSQTCVGECWISVTKICMYLNKAFKAELIVSTLLLYRISLRLFLGFVNVI